MWSLKQRVGMTVLTVFGLMSLCPSAYSLQTLDAKGSLKYQFTKPGGVVYEWVSSDHDRVAKMQALWDGDAVGFFVVASKDPGFSAYKISFEYEASRDDMKPYLHIYTKMPGQSKYEKDVIIPWSKLSVKKVGTTGNWMRADWNIQGGLGVHERFAKVVIVVKPVKRDRGDSRSAISVKRFIVDNVEQLNDFELTPTRLQDSPDKEFRD